MMKKLNVLSVENVVQVKENVAILNERNILCTRQFLRLACVEEVLKSTLSFLKTNLTSQ